MAWDPKTLDDFLKARVNQLKPISDVFDKVKGDLIDDNESNLMLENLYTNYKKLFDYFKNTYGVITIKKGTLVFHSNIYFQEHLEEFEPCGTQMKIQDIRMYSNKHDTLKNKFFMSETFSRVYCNFTPAGNMKVAGNMTIGEGIYVATKDMYFFQIPYDRNAHLKDAFKLTSSSFFKKYIKENNTEDRIYSGFILSTSIDTTNIIDASATRINHGYGIVVYPEILILDGFDLFRKIGQYDLIYGIETDIPNSKGYKAGDDTYAYLNQIVKDKSYNSREMIPITTQLDNITDFYKIKTIEIHNEFINKTVRGKTLSLYGYHISSMPTTYYKSSAFIKPVPAAAVTIIPHNDSDL